MDEITTVNQAVDGLMGAFSEFKQDYDRKLDAIDREFLRLNRPGLGGMDRTPARGDLAAERKAVGMFVRSGDERELKSVAGLSTDVDPAGGYVVLPQMASTMIRRIFDQSPIRRLARVQTIDTGDAWQEPLDLDEASASWVGEHAARPVLNAAQLGLLTVPLNELYSNQKVTQKLLVYCTKVVRQAAA